MKNIDWYIQRCFSCRFPLFGVTKKIARRHIIRHTWRTKIHGEKGGAPVINLLDKILIYILYVVSALFSLDDARNTYFMRIHRPSRTHDTTNHGHDKKNSGGTFPSPPIPRKQLSCILQPPTRCSRCPRNIRGHRCHMAPLVSFGERMGKASAWKKIFAVPWQLPP